MDWQVRLNKALDYMEEHLTSPCEWSRAAAAANCSTFHFLRMFEVILDISPGEYLRRRRLSQAAIELATSKEKVIDIALRFGYESPDAFTKAFRKLFEASPSEVQGGGVSIAHYPRITFSVVLKGTSAMNYRIETRPAFSLSGLSLRCRNDDGSNFTAIPQFWDRTMASPEYQALCALVPAGSAIGIAGVCTEFAESSPEFLYTIAVETPADRSTLPANCTELQINEATWAIFPCRGPLPGSIQTTWKRIYSEWFPGSGYEQSGAHSLEVYSMGDGSSPDYYSEVWIPVRKA